MRQDGGETPSVVSIPVPLEEARKVEGRVCAPEPSSKDDGGGTPLDVSGIEEICEGAKGCKPRVVASDERSLTEKVGDTGREGNGKLSLEASAIRCTASLRASDNRLGLRGLIPSLPSHAPSRDSRVGGALPYLPAAPNCCSTLTDRAMRACSDWHVRSTVQNLAWSHFVSMLMPSSCFKNLSESLQWPLRPLFPASGPAINPPHAQI